MKKRVLSILVICALMVMTFAGCGGSSSSSADTKGEAAKTTEQTDTTGKKDDGKQLFVAFSAGYGKVQHWELEMLGCEAAAKELGVKFQYQFADGNEQKQVADIENFVQMGIDMLIVGPNNSEGIVPTVNELKSKGVPVMTSDIGITGTEVVAHVASDNYQIGVKAADYLGELLKGKGKIAVVGWSAASATKERENGFTETMAKKYPGIQIVANQDVGGNRTTSLEKSENIIEANKDLNAIFGSNAENALGAYGATQAVNRKDIYVVAVDSDNEVMKAIADNTNLKATIAQNPYEMGYQALTTAVKHLKGEKVENIAIDAELVTSENVQKIIDRDQKYLGK